MWMSLDGEIAGRPRPDHCPYLQLDAEPDIRSVVLTEGDVWQGHGATNGAKRGELKLSEITTAWVCTKAVAILKRAAD